MSEWKTSSRYKVIDITSGKTVKDAFVLEPRWDLAARDALRVYALSTKNDSLADALLRWLEHLRTEDKKRAKRNKGRGRKAKWKGPQI